VCAHRYRIYNMKSGYSWGQGICVLFGNDLYAEPLEPCNNYAGLNNFKHQRCQCQAGTSTGLTAVNKHHLTLCYVSLPLCLLVEGVHQFAVAARGFSSNRQHPSSVH